MPRGVYIRTESVRRKAGLLRIGKKDSMETKRRKSEGIKKALSKPSVREKMKSNKNTLGKHWKVKDTSRMCGSRQGSESHLWKDGRCRDTGYISWIKNKRNRDKRNAEGSHTFGEWELLKKQYGYTCPCCKKSEPKVKLTEDHIVPLSKGGSDYIENIQPLCKSCNCKKHTTIIKY